MVSSRRLRSQVAVAGLSSIVLVTSLGTPIRAVDGGMTPPDAEAGTRLQDGARVVEREPIPLRAQDAGNGATGTESLDPS
ncbi:MAG TPA: hypothetical protein VH723_04255, partial [Candidatus Limnocylindrales bacterium]